MRTAHSGSDQAVIQSNYTMKMPLSPLYHSCTNLRTSWKHFNSRVCMNGRTANGASSHSNRHRITVQPLREYYVLTNDTETIFITGIFCLCLASQEQIAHVHTQSTCMRVERVCTNLTTMSPSWKSAECVKYFIYTFTSLHISTAVVTSLLRTQRRTQKEVNKFTMIHASLSIWLLSHFQLLFVLRLLRALLCAYVLLWECVCVCLCWANHLFMHSICNCVCYLYLLPRNVVTSRALLPHSFTRDMDVDVLGMLALVVINTLICSRCEFVIHTTQ